MNRNYYHMSLWDKLGSAAQRHEELLEQNEPSEWNEGYLAATYDYMKMFVRYVRRTGQADLLHEDCLQPPKEVDPY